jgi:hypothetical protein
MIGLQRTDMAGEHGACDQLLMRRSQTIRCEEGADGRHQQKKGRGRHPAERFKSQELESPRTPSPCFFSGGAMHCRFNTFYEIGRWIGAQIRVAQSRPQDELLVLSLLAVLTPSQMPLDTKALRDV